MEKKIYFLGPKTSYSDIAKELFIKNLSLFAYDEVPMQTITAMISEIENWENQDNLIVVPIENSIEGIVNETVDNICKIKNNDVKILAEEVLEIEHCLVGPIKDITKINKIISHPQALSQCHKYIYEKFGDIIELIPETSTAKAVAKLSEKDSTVAAIGNKISSQYYNKYVWAEAINDEKDNKTRFILLGINNNKNVLPNDKTSIMFSLENKSGALCDILTILKNNDINMTHISSRPSKKTLGEYSFFIDFDGNILEEKIQNAIFQILKHVKTFKHLGSYPKSVSNSM